MRSAAQTADEVRSTRRVNSTIVNVHQTNLTDDFQSALDINKVEQDLRLPDHIYNQFGLEDRKQWSGFSNEARRKFVTALSTGGTSSGHNPQHHGAPSRSQNRRSVNVTDLQEDDNGDDKPPTE